MAKRYEIVNRIWIKQLAFSPQGSAHPDREMYKAIKISSITGIETKHYTKGGSVFPDEHYGIHLYNGDSGVSLYYSLDDEQEYKEDLTFFEKLLFDLT